MRPDLDRANLLDVSRGRVDAARLICATARVTLADSRRICDEARRLVGEVRATREAAHSAKRKQEP
jgi:hypothetical protein